MLWNPYVEVAGVSAERSFGLGPVLVVARGDDRSVTLPPAVFFAPLLAAGAPGGVLVHTHPTGGLPTAEDLAVTRRLVSAGVLLGIPLVAHLVIGPTVWWDLINPLAERRRYSFGLGIAA